MRTVIERLEITQFGELQMIQDESLSSLTISHQALAGSLVKSSTYQSVVFSSCVFYACEFKEIVFRGCNFIQCQFSTSQSQNKTIVSKYPNYRFNTTQTDVKWIKPTHSPQTTKHKKNPLFQAGLFVGYWLIVNSLVFSHH